MAFPECMFQPFKGKFTGRRRKCDIVSISCSPSNEGRCEGVRPVPGKLGGPGIPFLVEL